MPFDLSPTEEQQALKETLADFSKEVLRPAARSSESAGRTSDDVARRIHEIGVTAPVDEQYGGGGTFDAVTYCIAAEELAWGDPGIAYAPARARVSPRWSSTRPGPTSRRRSTSLTSPKPSRRGRSSPSARRLRPVTSNRSRRRSTTARSSGEKYGVLNASDAAVRGRRGPDPGGAIGRGGRGRHLRHRQAGGQARPRGGADFGRRVRRDRRSARPTTKLEQAILWTKLATGAIAVGIGARLARVRGTVRDRARGVREADRCVPGDLFQDRRHGDRGRCGAPQRVASGMEDRSGRGNPRRRRRGDGPGARRPRSSVATTGSRSWAVTGTSGTTPSRSGSATR